VNQQKHKKKKNLTNLTELNQNLSTMGGSNGEAMNKIQTMSKNNGCKMERTINKT